MSELIKSKKTILNTVANLTSRLWSMLSTFIFLPLFLRYLDSEAYGLVTLFATFLAVMNLLGMGLSGALRREFAAGNESLSSRQYKFKLLKSVEFIYLFILIVILIIGFFISPYIAKNWLVFESLNVSIITTSITLMFISISIIILSNLWHGCILGLNNQVRANVYYVLWSIGKNILAILVIQRFPNPISFYLAYIIFDLLYAFFLRLFLVRRIKKSDSMKWNIKDLKLLSSVWKYTVGLLFITGLSILLTQIDRIILSRYISLTEIGIYNSIKTMGSLVRIIAASVGITVLTEFTNLFSQEKHEKLEKYYLDIWKYVSVATITLSVFVTSYSYSIMYVWTGDITFAEASISVAPYLLIGICGLALQEIPYSYLLSKGITKINIKLGLLILPIYVVLSYFLIRSYGIYGASLAYGITFSVHTILYFWLSNKSIKLKEKLYKSYLVMLLSAIISLGFSSISKQMVANISNQTYVVLIGITFGILALAVNLFVFGAYKFVKKYREVHNE